MALIGEQFDGADEICGVVASVRQRQDKLSLWTRTAANEAVQVCLVNPYWKLCHLSFGSFVFLLQKNFLCCSVMITDVPDTRTHTHFSL